MADKITDPDAKQLQDLVQLHARQLGEHADTVHIFVTKQLDGGEFTRSYEFGVGSYYARQGQVAEWLLTQEEYQREWARHRQRKDLKDDSSDGSDSS